MRFFRKNINHVILLVNTAKRKQDSSGVSVKIGFVFSVLVGAISVFLLSSSFWLSSRFNDVRNSTSKYMSWKQVALDVKEALDYLTNQVRYYVYIRDKEYMDIYFQEANINKIKDRAIEVIEQYLPNTKAHHPRWALLK